MTMITVAPIRNEDDYQAALVRLEAIMDAEADTPESDEFDVLSALIERYEGAAYPIEPPSALEAIRFRMEQAELTPRDLEPILGSRSRVSEILGGSRPLSVDMIRALNRHLGIPADALLREDEQARPPARLSKPVEERLRDWGILRAREGLSAFLSRALNGSPALAMLRQSRFDRTNAKTDPAAMQAWCAAALLRSHDVQVSKPFDKPSFARALRDIAQLSSNENGPAMVEGALSQLGVAFVALPHLPGTHLDGAAMLRNDGVPVVALTVRRDQIDSFWFTLMHELAHVAKHLNASQAAIVDDLEISSASRIEREADSTAEDVLIPRSLWSTFSKGEFTSKAEIENLAREARVHPAIVAARWRMTNRNYKRFSRMLGHGTVRRQLVNWPGEVGHQADA